MNRSSYAKSTVLVGLMAATLECAKLALSALPNIEIVTLLLALYSYCFGWLGVAASVVFVCIEPIIYGFGPWVIAYFIYWPLLAIAFMILGRLSVKNRIVITGAAVVMTFFFGVISSIVDVGLFSGGYDNFLYRFVIYYLRGTVFYTVQIITNLVLFSLLFPFLSEKLQGIKNIK